MNSVNGPATPNGSVEHVTLPPAVAVGVGGGAMSSLVRVQLRVTSATTVTFPLPSQSPLNPVNEYPPGPPVSVTLYVPLGSAYEVPASDPFCGLPLTSIVPDFTWSDQRAAFAVPALLLTMCFLTISVPVRCRSL